MIRAYPFNKNRQHQRLRHAGFVQHQIECLPIDQDWEVVIRLAKKTRTRPQNSYVHALLGIIAKETGQDPDSVKDTLVKHFLGLESESVVNGVAIPKRRSTAKLSTKECAEFCDQLRAWAAEFGLLLPLPEECQ